MMKSVGLYLVMIVYRLLLALLLAPLVVSAEPIIAEFMASNSTALADEDGDYSDWLEIYNPDLAAVNLAGWHLTDDSANLSKWTFPSVSLPAGGRMVVFASDKHRTVSGSELHTNFKLSAAGEYLALVKPDGATTTSEFNPYPEQITDYSYGLDQATSVINEEVDTASSFSYLVPSFDVAGWNTNGFDASGWAVGIGGVGYDNAGSNGYGPYISTDVKFQMSGRSTIYLRYEFDVDDAAAVLDMQLLAKYDDGFAAYLNGQLLTSDNVPASLKWNDVALSSQEAVLGSFTTWNLNDKLEHLVDGNNVLAIHLVNRFSSSSDLLMQTKLELTTEVQPVEGKLAYFATSTPGAANNSTPVMPSGEVAISVPSGVKSSAISVTLTSADPTASIYYTLDGSTPNKTSALYSSPLAISDPAQLRAVAFEPNKTASKVAVADYSFLDASLLNYLSDVPVIVMDNFGAGAYPSKGRSPDGSGIVQVARQSNVMSFFDVVGNSQPFSAAPALQSRAGCRVRGSSSSEFPRKSLSVELWDDTDDNSATPFGMASEADWVLSAPNANYDKALVNNPVSFEFGKLIGALAPDSKVVVVFQNTNGGKIGLGDLEGVYVWMEKIERKRVGVDFDKMNSDGSAGGWMIEVNRLDAIPQGLPASTVQPNFHAAGPNGVLEVPDDVDGASGSQPDDISTFYHSFLNFSEPNGYGIEASQRAHIQSKIRAMDSVMWSGSMGNETTGYPSVIDVDSWVKYYMAQNFAKNQDAIVLSTYLMSRDATSKIEMGPIWDFDRAYTLQGSAESSPLWASGRDWYKALFNDANFRQAYQDAWQEARRTVITDSVLIGLIDEAVAGLRADQIEASGISYWSWQSQVASMKTWVVDRAHYLDSQYASLPSHSPATREFSDSVVMAISPTAGGSIYYTTDGSDPRAWNGGLSASAQLYNGALTFTERTRVTFRARNGSWSGKVTQDYYQPSKLPNLAVSAVDYNPLGASPMETTNGYTGANDFEYVEILNAGTSTVDLSTLALDGGISFDFEQASSASLAAGERALVVSNQAAFNHRHGTLAQVVGEYSGHLKNSSEQIVLKDKHLDIEFQNFTYDDDTPWPTAADGNGYSLILKKPLSMPDHTLPSNWRASSFVYGSPGTSDALPSFVGDPAGDSDHDGITAILEHYLGTSDLEISESGQVGRISSVVREQDGLLYPTFSIDYLIGVEDVSGRAEWSSTLLGWDGSSSRIILMSDLPNGDGTATKTWRSTQPFIVSPQFFRFRLE